MTQTTSKTTYQTIGQAPFFMKQPLQHTLFYGHLAAGRDRQLVSVMSHLMQVLTEEKDVKYGGTLVVETPRLGASLYALLKSAKNKRRIKWLNPATDLGIKHRLAQYETYDAEWFNKFIMDYHKALRNGWWVILDLAEFTQDPRYDRWVGDLLFHLEATLSVAFPTRRQAHFLMIENAPRHIERVTHLLTYGTQLETYLYLWASTPQAFTPQMLTQLEMYMGHTILNGRHALSDQAYFQQLFPTMMQRLDAFAQTTHIMVRSYRENQVPLIAEDALRLMSDEEYKRLRNNGQKALTLCGRDCEQQEKMEAIALADAQGDECATILVGFAKNIPKVSRDDD